MGFNHVLVITNSFHFFIEAKAIKAILQQRNQQQNNFRDVEFPKHFYETSTAEIGIRIDDTGQNSRGNTNTQQPTDSTHSKSGSSDLVKHSF